MIKNKKVLFVITEENIKRHCMPILKYLKEEKFEIHVISKEAEKIQYCDKQFILPFNKQKIKIYKFIKEILQRNEYHFIQCYNSLEGIITRIVAKKRKTKIIYINQGFTFYKGSKLRKWLIYYPIEKYLSKYTDILITTNEDDYILAKNKFKSPKIKYINGLGIDEQEYCCNITDDKRKEFLEEFNLKKEDYIFLSIGGLDKTNNQILQIEAIMQIIPEYKNIKLLIEGEGPLEEYYSNILQKYRLTEYIKLIGKRENIQRFIELTDGLLITKKKNRNTSYIIQTMFASKPIIASRIREHKQLLKENMLVGLNNSTELIRKIEKNIIEGKRVTDYDINKYKLENVAEQIKNIYQSFIENY